MSADTVVLKSSNSKTLVSKWLSVLGGRRNDVEKDSFRMLLSVLDLWATSTQARNIVFRLDWNKKKNGKHAQCCFNMRSNNATV